MKRTFGMGKNSQIDQRYKNFIENRKNQNIESQITEAEQIVHSIDKIDSRKAFKKVQSRILKKQDYIRFLNILTRAAAILFIPLLVVSIFFYESINKVDCKFSTQIISNPSGVRSEIILPDSSKVWLNAESTISYNVPFGLKERNVNLAGEAFFEVKKDKHRPFHVKSDKAIVSVLGTHFNYKAYPEDTDIEVVLAEGKIELCSTDVKATKGIIMKPGERAVVNRMTSDIAVSTGNIEKYIGWHEGKLIFDECPLPEVAKRLERWFGIEVKVVDPKVQECRISTTFENEPLPQILNLLELASPIKTKLIPGMSGKVGQPKGKTKVIITSKN